MATETESEQFESDGSGQDAAPGLPDHSINSRETFDWVKADPRQVAGLYTFCELDVLVDLARAVALDFFECPRMYTRVSGDATRAIAEMHARYGADEFRLAGEQRKRIYAGVFGEDETSDFAKARDALLSACAAFAERVFDSGELMLRASVASAHRKFRAYLQTRAGSSLNWTSSHALPGLVNDAAYPILRDRGVAAVFGVGEEIDDEFPYAVDPNGDKIVEEISRRRNVPADAPMTCERFSARQRVALRGAEAIATVLDFSGSEDPRDMDLLITKCYTWQAAIVDDLGAAPTASPNGNRRLERPALPATTVPVPEPVAQPSYVR